MGELVECRSDWSYAQRPLAFQWEGQRRQVAAILAEQRTPEGLRFLVRSAEDELFELIYHQNLDHWTIQPQAAKESA